MNEINYIERTIKNPHYNMCKKHFNEPMIVGEIVVRCIGYCESPSDCFIIYRKIGSVNNPGKIEYWTCVGGYFWLNKLKRQGIVKAKYPKYPDETYTDFSRIDSTLELNGCPKEKYMRVEVERI